MNLLTIEQVEHITGIKFSEINHDKIRELSHSPIKNVDSEEFKNAIDYYSLPTLKTSEIILI